MQPQRAHRRQSGVAGLAHQGVIVRQQSVAQFEEFSTDRLDFGVMEFRRIGAAGSFNRAKFGSVPAPWKAQMPGAAMRTKQGIEGRELKPTRVKLAGKRPGRHESTDVSAPKGREAQ